MKTLYIDCSPKKRFCASAYFLTLQRLFTGGESVREKLRTPADHARILEQFNGAQAVVFCLPLYVDGIPSHVLRFLKEAENYCKANNLHICIYAIANNGFIEGRQNEPLMQQFERFCERAGLNWCGGVGIGGGVMLNVTRIMFVVDIVMLLINIAASLSAGGGVFPADAWEDFSVNAALLLFFNAGVLFYLIRMGSFIRRHADAGKRYTRIMVPSFIFILFADIFFVIISFFEGGLFRGWLSKKEADE